MLSLTLVDNNKWITEGISRYFAGKFIHVKNIPLLCKLRKNPGRHYGDPTVASNFCVIAVAFSP